MLLVRSLCNVLSSTSACASFDCSLDLSFSVLWHSSMTLSSCPSRFAFSSIRRLSCSLSVKTSSSLPPLSLVTGSEDDREGWRVDHVLSCCLGLVISWVSLTRGVDRPLNVTSSSPPLLVSTLPLPTSIFPPSLVPFAFFP